MGNDLVLASSVRSLGAVVTEVVRGYNLNRTVSKAELRKLNDEIEFARARAKARRKGDLVRLSIDEIAETQALIDSKSLSEHSLTCAIQQLEALSQELLRITKDV